MKSNRYQWEWNDLKPGENSSSLGGRLRPSKMLIPTSGKSVIVCPAPSEEIDECAEFWNSVLTFGVKQIACLCPPYADVEERKHQYA